MLNDSIYFEDSPRNVEQDQSFSLVSKAFKVGSANVQQVHQLVQDAKFVKPGFMTSPVIGLTLMRSVQMNRKDVVKCLISEGASINMLFRGRTMLHIAVKSENTVMLQFLLSFDGVDKNKKDVKNLTPLMEAACGKPACLKILLDAGCNIHIRDSKGLTALHHIVLASQAKREDVIQCLDTFLAYGADINQQDGRGESCLHKAIKMSNHWLVQWFILNNCDINLNGPKAFLNTGPLPILRVLRFKQASPFILAFQKADRILVEVLIACGCEFRKHQNILEFCVNYRLLHLNLQKAMAEVDSLQALCRKTIRRHLSTNIVFESTLLGLPTCLQRYILCRKELSALDHFE